MSLPSYDSASQWLRGKPGGGAAVLASTLGHALIIGVGGVAAARASGATTPLGTLAAFAIGGAVAVELFVLYYASRELAAERAAPTPEPAAVVSSPVVIDFGRF